MNLWNQRRIEFESSETVAELEFVNPLEMNELEIECFEVRRRSKRHECRWLC